MTNNISLLIAVSAPYAVLVAVAALVTAVLGRRAVLSLVAVVVVATSLGVQLNWYYGNRVAPPDEGVEIRVLSANLRKGQADVHSVADLARSSADVITLSELTPEWVRQFYAAGMREVFPHSVLLPTPEAGGIGIWSRYPVDVVTPLKGQSTVAARVRVPDLPNGVVVAAVHVINPLTFYGKAFDEWQIGIAGVKTRMTELAENAGGDAVIVAGDFNSTPDMPQFRNLLSGDFVSAVSQSGSGWTPTFPSARWSPPLIAIDHILLRHARATSVEAVAIRRSDHRALLATVVAPITPSKSTENGRPGLT
ncbi:endonuclease/exonuclease/phosphatase family protein [Mycobacterium sp. SMC-4]|uniref:endonuclease/exonuclease/phosphatase family protein n=1 Tax=Mycobacterium sp. SMC-4 TaxID=2857059 RepID=UPI003D021D49